MMIQDSGAVGPLIMIILMIMMVPGVFFSNDNDIDNDDSRWLNKAGVSSNVQCAWNPWGRLEGEHEQDGDKD